MKISKQSRFLVITEEPFRQAPCRDKLPAVNALETKHETTPAAVTETLDYLEQQG